MEYAPGLNIKWTTKEWNKIQEIKARENREKHSLNYVPWDEEKIQELIESEEKDAGEKRRKRDELIRKHMHRNCAMRSLHSYGFTIIEIAELFKMRQNTVKHIVVRETLK